MEFPDVPLDGGHDRFQTAMAVLIAVVTLVGAVLAWRAAIAADDAGDADFAGLKAVLHAEETRMVNDVNALRHYRAYTAYTQHEELRLRLAQLGDVNGEVAATNLATTSQVFFPTRYLNLNGSYDLQREVAELWAQAQQVTDLDPVQHFDEADAGRVKTIQLVAAFILLSLSLLFYTSAEGIHPERPLIRYGLGALGTVFLLATLIAAFIIETA